MPLLKNVEGKIRAVEGFDVAIKYPNGRNIRGDRPLKQRGSILRKRTMEPRELRFPGLTFCLARR